MDTTEQKIQASDKASQDEFGHSVSISGDYAIVGAYNKSSSTGDVYIYTRDASTGVWGSEQKIQTTDIQTGDRFGSSVSINGDYVIVGAPYEDTGGAEAGAAYIFKRSGTTWLEKDKLTADNAATQDRFGSSVSINGDYTIVGAYFDDNKVGSAYIFKRDTGAETWTQKQRITAGTGQAEYGWSVSISGDYAVASARYDDSYKGSAYIYKRDTGAETWTQQKKISIPDDDATGSDSFGTSVSISGDYVFVGSTGTSSAKGFVYVFKRDGVTWTQQQKLTPSDAASQDQFGWSTNINGDYAIVGARKEDPDGIGDAGAAYVFKYDGTTWLEEAKLTASDAASQDEFGYSVSISGEHAIVGASGKDSNIGAAYIYKAPDVPSPKLTYDTYNKLTLSNVSTSYSSTLRYESNTYDIGSASTIIIQDPGRYEIATTDDENFMSLNSNVTGQTVTQVGVYDYTQADTTEQKITASDAATNDYFGHSVSISGDYAIVGASQKGEVDVFLRNTSTGTWFEQQKLTSGTSGDSFGIAVAIDGDYAVIGATGDGGGGIAAGAAYIFKRDGTTGSWSQQQKIVSTDIAAYDSFGNSVAISGDYAFVGCRYDDDDGNGSGSVYVFSRSGTNWTQHSKLKATDASENAEFGTSVSVSGDYTIFGAARENSYVGSAYIFKYNGTSWLEHQKLTASDTPSGNSNRFGWSVSISGDYAIVGAQYGDADVADTGAAYIYTRDSSTGLWGSEQKITASDAAASDQFGLSVSIDGDYAIVGALVGDSTIATNSGVAYIFKRDGTSWSEQAKLTASDAAANDEYGTSVAIDNGHAIVGAIKKNSYTGAAYIYTAENLASTLAYDGLNTLVLSNVSTGSYNTFLEGSNVLACATDLTTYPVPKSGVTGTFTYSARTKSDSAFAFTNDVSITDYYKTYQYPPIDGTTSGLTTSTTADTWNTWTISGAANGNGTYKAKWSVATDNTPYNTFRNNVGSTNYVQTAINPTYPIDITLELPSAKTVRKYRMFPLDHVNPYGPGTDATSGTSVDPTLPGNGGDDATKRPKSWILYGYRTDPENPGWESLDTVTDKPISIYGDIYSIDTPGSYQQYKLSVTANNGGDKLLFGDIQLWGDA
jgi:hypothetical protein